MLRPIASHHGERVGREVKHGVEVDVCTCGDFAQDAATEDQVRAAISRYVADTHA
jgi:hypothetical protein